MTAPRCAELAELLPLRAGGRRTGLFSDHGSWLAVCWGSDSLFELHDTLRDRVHVLDLGAPAGWREAFPDRLEAALEDGARVRLAFASAERLVVEHRHDRPPAVGCDLRWELARVEDGVWWILLGDDPAEPPADLFERNRARWDAWFTAAAAQLVAPSPRDLRLAARAVTTLEWNRRAPVRALPAAGVVPSPFAYRGYWGWDSWKHARALARFDPELGLDQLEAQFSAAGPDGMVADTAMPDAARNNLANTKPPMAAWALVALQRAGADPARVAGLRKRCVEQLRWWSRHRRARGELAFRHGGRDHETATWDTGWDLSVRFEATHLEPHGDWLLFDLWQPDLHSYLLVEFRALAELTAAEGGDPAPWRERAEQLERWIRDTLWDAERGFFCDRSVGGASTGVRSAAGWLPLWAGAASPEQAAAARAVMLDPAHFASPVPFPALACSEPGFDPDAYWNGGVWIDHAVLGAAAAGEEGAPLRERLLDAVDALPAFYECLSPRSGEPCHGARPAVPQFSWSAAAVLELLAGGPAAP